MYLPTLINCSTENLPVNGLAVGKLQVHDRVEEVIKKKKGRTESDVIHDFGMASASEYSVPVLPVFEKKRKLKAFIHEINFFGAHLLIHNFAFPYLPEKQKVQFQMHFVPCMASVKAEHLYGWERWIQP